MGKRKKASKPMAKKKKEGLPSTFQCLFCNHENSVNVKIEKKMGIGQLFCKVCGQTFQTSINNLQGAVDVYADWVDACDAVAKEHEETTKLGTGSYPDRYGAGLRGGATQAQAGGDDFIVDDEMDAEGDFAEEE